MVGIVAERLNRRFILGDINPNAPKVYAELSRLDWSRFLSKHS